jgi:thioesterase domain-containing protein
MCDGVHIGQQMILELESLGEEVALFVIFDTWVFENSQIRPLWMLDYYLSRVRRIPDMRVHELLAIGRRMLRRSLRRKEAWNKSEWEKQYWPDEDFRPPSFQAPVLLFKRRRQPYFYIRDPHMGWGARSSGGIEICEIECSHFEVLRAPHVQLIARRLAQRLQQISQRAQEASLASNRLQPRTLSQGSWPVTA